MGGLAYPITVTSVLIGSKNSANTRTSIALDSTYQTNEATKAVKSFETAGFSKINFDVLYTMGDAETSNSIEIKLESSDDKTNWYQIVNEASTAGASTVTVKEITFVGTNGTTASFSYLLDIAYKYMRISVKETGVASNVGSVFVEATISGK